MGAPRAQSTLESQKNINETGAIYRCSLINGSCSPYVLDSRGDVKVPQNEYTIESERKDHQWLGMSMDGGTRDTDKLLVCAPRFYAPTANDYHMHGNCYWVQNTIASNPEHVTRISPLRLNVEQVTEDAEGVKHFNYIFAEMGLSAHVTDDNSKFLIGCPGINTWKGSVVLYRQVDPIDNPSASRRDTSSKPRRRVRNTDTNDYVPDYSPEIPRPASWDQKDDSYFGYAVSSGYFNGNQSNLLYVATAPQANKQSGEAYIFDVRGKTIKKHYTFRGEQFGEYFGYSVVAEDLNGDGKTDVIISAPQYALEDSHDNGAIYVFLNKGFVSNISIVHCTILISNRGEVCASEIDD